MIKINMPKICHSDKNNNGVGWVNLLWLPLKR